MSLINYNNVDVYQAESLILKDVNFHVDEGEFIYIIGSKFRMCGSYSS